MCVILVFTRTEPHALNVLQTQIQQSTACLQQPVGVILVSPKSEKIVNAPQAPLYIRVCTHTLIYIHILVYHRMLYQDLTVCVMLVFTGMLAEINGGAALHAPQASLH